MLIFGLKLTPALSQSTQATYPSSPTISPATLSPERRSQLEQLFQLNLTYEERLAISAKLCPHNLSASAPSPQATKSSMLITEAALVTELEFERLEGATLSEVSSISLLVEFKPSRVLLRHRQPRFPSAAAGFSVPMPLDRPRPVRVEGRFGSDILAFIPATRECGVQGVALCPVSYKPPNTLQRGSYRLKGVRPFATLKADGLYSPANNTAGKIQASLLASSHITLPAPWFSSNSGARTLSADISHSDKTDQAKDLPNSVSADTLPINLSAEARVDVGSEQTPLRSASKRVSLNVSTITIPRANSLLIDRSDFSFEGGECYLVTTWSENTIHYSQ